MFKKEREINFAGLLGKIGEVALKANKECWIYFTSPHPRDMSPEVIDVMATYPHIAKQVHLPLQSGDDKILVKMNRNHSLDQYREIVQLIREKLPDSTLFTDLIVGFTGETEAQHQHTLDAMREFEFNMAYVAQYSPRPGAASYRWDNNVSSEDKKIRLQQMNELLAETAGRFNQKMIGQTLRVLVTGVDRKPGYLKGLTEGKINVRFRASQLALIGHFADLQITGSNGLSLEGRMAPARMITTASESLNLSE